MSFRLGKIRKLRLHLWNFVSSQLIIILILSKFNFLLMLLSTFHSFHTSVFTDFWIITEFSFLHKGVITDQSCTRNQGF